MALLTIGVSSTNAQIGNLGIYGRVPDAHAEDIVYVYLVSHPAWDGSPDHFRPVNGLGNFNLYYTPDGTDFIPSSSYRVWYFGKDKTTTYGYDDVAYTANSGNTNGYQIRAFNNPPSWPVGVHGVVLAKIPGQGGTTTAHTNATISLAGIPGFYFYKAKTNGNGYASVYYNSVNSSEFLPYSEVYDLKISGTLTFGELECDYLFYDDDAVIWTPPEGYVYQYDLGTITLQSEDPGCAP